MDNNSSKHLSKIPTPLEGGDEGGLNQPFELQVFLWIYIYMKKEYK